MHIALKNHQTDSASASASASTSEAETPRPKFSKKSSAQQMFGNNNSNSSEKKKKSLPVRKLLELERASQVGHDDVKGGPDDDVIQSEMVKELPFAANLIKSLRP